MKDTISILGCGWLGKPLAIELIKNKFVVKGSTTTQGKLLDLKTLGIKPHLINIDSIDYQISDFLNADILIIAITSKNIDDYKNLISEIEKSAIKKVLFVSSTSVYPNSNSVVTEESEFQSSALTEIEALFRNNSNLYTTILRFGGLIGYDRQPSNFFKNNKQIPDPEGYVNLIHQDDCIQIIQKIIALDYWNTTFNACADSHPTRRAFYTKELKKAGNNTPNFNEKAENTYKIVSNEKLKKALNYKFKYSDLMEY